MTNFTKLFCSLALMLFCAIGAYAQEEVHATFENVTSNNVVTWDADNKTFSWNQGWSNQLHGITLPKGDITEYESVVVDCTILNPETDEPATEGSYRIMFYSSDKGTTAGGTTVIDKSGKKTFKLADFDMDASYLTKNTEFCLSGNGGSGKVKINDLYFIKGADPLANLKSQLTKAITAAKYYQSEVYTEESFETLTVRW